MLLICIYKQPIEKMLKHQTSADYCLKVIKAIIRFFDIFYQSNPVQNMFITCNKDHWIPEIWQEKKGKTKKFAKK